MLSTLLLVLSGSWSATAHAQQVPAQPAYPQPSTAAPLQSPLPTAAPPAAEPRFMVVLDPAHGGADAGALLGAGDPEKNFIMTLAIRLHALLHARGIHSILTRDGDTTLDNNTRATIANSTHAAACVLLHATSTGNGVHMYTSSLPAAGPQDARRAFLPWQTAQASYEMESLRLESDMNSALTRQHIPVLLARTSIMPLDSMACPAVAVEIAPFDVKTPLTDLTYQEQIIEALATALQAWRSDWRMQP